MHSKPFERVMLPLHHVDDIFYLSREDIDEPSLA